MTNFLQVTNLTKSFGDRILYHDINFTVCEGDKIGIIARNGTGKSTLLDILTGCEEYDTGTITYHNDLATSIVRQYNRFDPEKTVLETCISDNTPEAILLREYEETLTRGNDTTHLLDKMDSLNIWTLEDRFKQLLSILKIDDITQKIGELSGGQTKKVAIAKALINNPQLLFLDEPTNHLDIEIIEWLENYLSRSKMTILMVTHDRYFLEKICNRIIEIDNGSIFEYPGNYDYYLEKRAERYDQLSSEITKANNLYRRELDWMRRQPQARAGKAKYRIDAFYDLQKKAQQRISDDRMTLNVQSSYIGSKIFNAVDVSKKFESTVILSNFNYIFARYEKLGIVGNNGVGKSTFIKLLQGLIQPDSGHFDVGSTVKFGYYGQEFTEFDNNKKVIDVIREIAEVVRIDDKKSYTAAQFLNHFLFSPADQQKYVYKLSGGEKRRLYLASVLMKQPNFLILDEPTNDLDIITLGILEEYIRNFKGCVIIISHDRYFMDRSVDHIFVMKGNGVIKDFPGNYSEYRAWYKEHEKELIEENKPKISSQKAKPSSNRPARLSFKEKKELEALTNDIERLEKEKQEIEAIFNGTTNSATDFNSLSQRYNTIKEELDEKELRWLELSELGN